MMETLRLLLLKLRPLLACLVVALGAWLLHRTLRGYSLEELAAQLAAVAPTQILAALGWAALSYGCLTLFDYSALRYAGKPLAYPKAALASFVSLSIGHNLGFAALSSGAVRYRYYSRWGLGAGDVAKVILYCGLTVAVGLASLAALALLFRQDLAARITGLSPGHIIALGLAIAALPVLYLCLCAFVRGELRIRSWSIRLPGFKLACVQLAIGSLNFIFVAACLHQALSTVAAVNFFDVAASYVIANIASLITHVPGGLGVLETVVMTALPGARLLGGLILFRLVYFLVPLVLGASLLAISELALRRSPARA